MIEMLSETISDKNLHELERLTQELLEIMRKAKIQDAFLSEALTQLHQEASDARRNRFDARSPKYTGY
jgi:hypothetical protein